MSKPQMLECAELIGRMHYGGMPFRVSKVSSLKDAQKTQKQNQLERFSL
jgi:hypothetical protein